MFKKKYFSTKHDFKTGFYFKLSLIVGIFLLSIFIIFKLFSFVLNESYSGFLRGIYLTSKSSIIDSIGALSILFIAFGIIIYFLHLQFVKLNEIAEDVEEMLKKEE